jgi:hypothetical protein
MVNERKGKGDGFPVPKDSYKKMLVGFGLIVIGFVLMMGAGASSPDTFNYDIFSFRRVTLAPAVVLVGFGFVFWAIIRNPAKKERE